MVKRDLERTRQQVVQQLRSRWAEIKVRVRDLIASHFISLGKRERKELHHFRTLTRRGDEAHVDDFDGGEFARNKSIDVILSDLLHSLVLRLVADGMSSADFLLLILEEGKRLAARHINHYLATVGTNFVEELGHRAEHRGVVGAAQTAVRSDHQHQVLLGRAIGLLKHRMACVTGLCRHFGH